MAWLGFGDSSDVIVRGLSFDLKKARAETDALRVNAGFGEEAASLYSDYLGPVLGPDVALTPTHKLLAGIDRAFRERRYLERKLDAIEALLARDVMPGAEVAPTSWVARLREAHSIARTAQMYLDNDQAISLPYEWERSS
jgi:hypothetical protein